MISETNTQNTGNSALTKDKLAGDKAIITVASNKFFPSLLNLIGSIKKFNPELPIYVYDLGLFKTFRDEVSSIPGVTMCEIEMETDFWRACYTWKSGIFKRPKAKLNLYLDAGNELLRPIDEMFALIEKQGYLVVEQIAPISDITPSDYISKFNISSEVLQKNAITAGIFGFSIEYKPVQDIIEKLYEASKQGYCLGFSKIDLWKNKGVNKTEYVRDCKIFRHDTTLFSLFLRRDIPDLQVGKFELYGGSHSKDYPGQFLWNMRMNYSKLIYLKDAHKLAKNKISSTLNTILINLFIFFKNIRLMTKKAFSLIPKDVYAKTFGDNLMFMDGYHEYPDHSNVRYYHRKKAYVVNSFIQEHASAELSFLDAGAGTGPYSKIGSIAGFKKVYVYEYDQKELDRAKINLSQINQPSNIFDFEKVDLKSIPLPENAVDICVCSEVLEHIPEEHLAAAELYRVMKPGGKMLFSMPNGQSLFYKKIRPSLKDLLAVPIDTLPYPDWERVRHISFTSKKIEKLLTDAGFIIYKRRGVNVLPLPTGLREKLETKLPFLFRLFVKFDRLLSVVLPRYGSFYFVEVYKPNQKN